MKRRKKQSRQGANNAPTLPAEFPSILPLLGMIGFGSALFRMAMQAHEGGKTTTARFKIGQPIHFVRYDLIHSGKVQRIILEKDADQQPHFSYQTDLEGMEEIPEKEAFPALDELVNHLKSNRIASASLAQPG